MKTKKFQITFTVEVDTKVLEGLSDGDATQTVIDLVEETWDLGQARQKEDRKPKGTPLDDSYGFEAELIDG